MVGNTHFSLPTSFSSHPPVTGIVVAFLHPPLHCFVFFFLRFFSIPTLKKEDCFFFPSFLSHMPGRSDISGAVLPGRKETGAGWDWRRRRHTPSPCLGTKTFPISGIHCQALYLFSVCLYPHHTATCHLPSSMEGAFHTPDKNPSKFTFALCHTHLL